MVVEEVEEGGKEVEEEGEKVGSVGTISLLLPFRSLGLTLLALK